MKCPSRYRGADVAVLPVMSRDTGTGSSPLDEVVSKLQWAIAMATFRSAIPVLLVVGLLAACSSQPALSADVTDSLRAALDSRGLKNVTISQNREKGVVTLAGKVPTGDEKVQAAAIAQNIAPGQVVANEVEVVPVGMESEAEDMHDALDDGITSNIKALFIANKVANDVSYSVRARVVTLTGTVASPVERDGIAKAVAGVANVTQVVNEMEVKNQKATSSPKP